MPNSPDKSSTKKRRTTTSVSAVSGADVRRKHRERVTSAVWRNFPINLESVPASLHGPKPRTVLLSDLAARLGVPQERLLPLIERGYLNLLTADPPVIDEPPPAAVEWLRQMFLPLPLRPMVPAEMISQMEHVSVVDVRRLCLAYDIPIQDDPVFGELLSIASYYRFHVQLHHFREPSRFDRQMMMATLMRAADPERYRGDLNPPSYSKRLEKEIRRVAKMKEPQRTDAALRLWESYEDALEVVKAVAEKKRFNTPYIAGMKRVETMVTPSSSVSPE